MEKWLGAHWRPSLPPPAALLHGTQGPSVSMPCAQGKWGCTPRFLEMETLAAHPKFLHKFPRRLLPAMPAAQNYCATGARPRGGHRWEQSQPPLGNLGANRPITKDGTADVGLCHTSLRSAQGQSGTEQNRPRGRGRHVTDLTRIGGGIEGSPSASLSQLPWGPPPSLL